MTTPIVDSAGSFRSRTATSFGPSLRSLRPARVALLSAVLLACSDAIDERNEIVLRELRANERAWYAANVQNYSMIIVRRCTSCGVQLPGPARVDVANGVVTAQTITTTGLPVSDAAKPLVPNVEGLFAELKRNMATNWRSLQVIYDPVLGYPIRFRMDNDLTNTAEDLMIDVSDFVQR